MITDKAEIKIAMLAVYYAFAVEVEQRMAQESILSVGQINVFDCQECERELIEEGLLRYCTIEGKVCCGITGRGVLTYEQGKTLMKKNVLEPFVAEALRYFDSLCSGRKYKTDIFEADGGYYVTCALRSEKRTYMEAKFFFEDRREADEAYENCKRRPEVVFSGVETLMTGKINHLL